MFGKNPVLFAACLTLLSATSAPASSAAAMTSPNQVPVPLDKVFVPVGFDDNDVSQLVVAGQFADTCHKLGPTHIRIDEATSTIWLEQTAYQYSEICLRMFVPFTQVVSVGLLRASEYAIADEVSKQKLGAMPVQVAKSAAADDFLYAPVTDADVVPGTTPGKHTLVLRGAFTDRCTTMREVRVGYHGDTIVVQPIVNYQEGRGCGYLKTRFDYRVELTRELKGAYLVHVRVMNGQAINKIVDLP